MPSDLDAVAKFYPGNSYVRQILTFLYEMPQIQGIYVAGAITFNRVDELSDLDIHLVIQNDSEKSFISALNKNLTELPVLYRINGRSYPWYGKLETIYLNSEPLFYFDIGYIELKNVDNFYFQLNGIIIKDCENIINRNVLRSKIDEKTKVEQLLNFHVDQVVSSSIKLSKDIKRKLFFNGKENLMQLRRAYIFVLCYEKYYSKKFPFIGRAERDFEIIADIGDVNVLKGSCEYNSIYDLRSCLVHLVDLLLDTKTISSRLQVVEILTRVKQANGI